MKVLMVLEKDFPPDVRVQNEAEALIKKGNQVFVAGYGRQIKVFKEEVLDNGIHVFKKPISGFLIKSSVGCLKVPVYFSYWRRYLNHILEGKQFDVIHIHDLPLAQVGIEMSLKYNIPVVLDLHENWPAHMEMAKHTNTFLGRLLSSNRRWRNYEKRVTKQVDAIVTVVEEMKNRVSALGVDENKISVVSNTLELDKFKLPDLKPDPNFVTMLYAGGITYHRGVQVVIRAVALLKDEYENIRFWIIGAGSYEKELKELVSELGVGENVHFLGWRTHDEIAAHLMQSDIALIPHLKSEQTDNSSPNKLFQYMYANKPILASNCNSVQRVIEKEKVGVTYEHDNEKDFAEKFKLLINNKVGFNNGHDIVKERYTWEKSANNLIDLYQNLEK
jgi:glycosyltransferase involved in cell wall biosynthesis